MVISNVGKKCMKFSDFPEKRDQINCKKKPFEMESTSADYS